MPRRRAVAEREPAPARHFLMVLEEAHIDRATGEVTAWAEPADLMLREALAALREHPSISVADRDAVADAMRKVTTALHFFRFHADPAVRAMGMNGMAGALLSGLHHPGGPDFARRTQAEAEAAGRGQGPGKTQKMNRERRDKAVAIVIRLADAHWVQKPADRSSPHRTAKAIARAVWAEVQMLEAIPPRWVYKNDAQYADMLRHVIPKSETVDG